MVMERQESEYKCLTKCQLAELCGISRGTLHRWMNHRYYKELSDLGYQKNQRILLPLQVKFLFEKLVITEE